MTSIFEWYQPMPSSEWRKAVEGSKPASYARAYLKRADDYRSNGHELCAVGCERKALRKLEIGYLCSKHRRSQRVVAHGEHHRQEPFGTRSLLF